MDNGGTFGSEFSRGWRAGVACQSKDSILLGSTSKESGDGGPPCLSLAPVTRIFSVDMIFIRSSSIQTIEKLMVQCQTMAVGEFGY